jgi:F0F1-type ATP synthase membrane subunit b/b'
LEAAKGLAGNSEALHAEADGILDEARVKAAGIRQKAVDEAKVLAESKAESKQSELDHEYESFLTEIVGRGKRKGEPVHKREEVTETQMV